MRVGEGGKENRKKQEKERGNFIRRRIVIENIRVLLSRTKSVSVTFLLLQKLVAVITFKKRLHYFKKVTDIRLDIEVGNVFLL